jgi:hypothetical protein
LQPFLRCGEQLVQLLHLCGSDRDDFFLLILVMDFFLIVLRSRPCDAHISAIAALVSAAASSSSNSCAFAAALATVVFVFVVDFDD